MSKPKNRIEPIKKAEVKESKQVEEQSMVRNFTAPQAMESAENFELSVPIVVQNVAYVDKKFAPPNTLEFRESEVKGVKF